MRGAKGVANEKAVAESGELSRKSLVVFFFLGMEADIFKNEYFTVAQGFALAFGAGADTIERKGYGITQKFLQLFRGRRQGIFQIGAPFGAAQMRSKNEARTFLNRKAQCRKRFADAGVVGDRAVLERNVEVGR